MLGELTLAHSGSDLAMSFMPGLALTWLGLGSGWPSIGGPSQVLKPGWRPLYEGMAWARLGKTRP